MNKRIFLLFALILLSTSIYAQQTMYWIGGAGDWDQLTHWSFQSGSQAELRPSSIPTANTNVIFDGASGFSGTGLDATRQVNLTKASTILSLTFAATLTSTNSPKIAGAVNLTVLESATFQPFVELNLISAGIARSLVMAPPAGKTSTLTLNGMELKSILAKTDAGTLDIADGFNTVNATYALNISGGTVNMPATTWKTGIVSISGSSVLNVTNLVDWQVAGDFALQNTARVNAPLLEKFAVKGNFTLTSTIPLTLPSLKSFSMSTMQQGAAGTLNMLNNVTVTAFNWGYIGNINLTPGANVFNITGGSFSSKNGSVIHKVNINNVESVNRSVISGNSSIEELTFANVAFLLNNTMTIGTLKISPYTAVANVIANGSNITIGNTIIDSTPDCVGYYTIAASNSGAARITKTAGGIDLKNVTLQGLTGAGGATFNAIGVDGGSNNNWNFIEPAPKMFFWVGPGADWNDQANWSATSGGPGGYCVPTRYDNVFFDKNSRIPLMGLNFVSPANFHDIHIGDDTPNATLAIKTGQMNCFGSWYMKSGVSIGSQTAFLSKDAGETITSNGSRFSTTTFQGLGGWKLVDGMYTANIVFDGGTLNTNSQTVYSALNFAGAGTLTPAALQGGVRNLILGASVLTIDKGDWLFDGTVDAGTSHIKILAIKQVPIFNSKTNNVYFNVSFLPSTPNTNISARIVNQNTFNILYIRTKNTNIEASTTVNIIDVSPNSTVTVTSNTTLTVTDRFIGNTADCSGLMILRASGAAAGNTIKFDLVKTSGTLHIANVIMQGVHAKGGATFTATGLDEYNNPGWTFLPTVSKELYWIGTTGDGNWNTGLNWTTNSNGTPSADACVPTKYDNIHFNSFSGSNGLIVTILNQSAYFNNFTIHDDAPSDITITQGTVATQAYAYGNYIKMGKGTVFNSVHLLGAAQDGQLIMGSNGIKASQFISLTVNNVNAKWVITNNLTVTGTYSQIAKQVDFNMDTYKGYNFTILDGITNLNISEFNLDRILTFAKGVLNAKNVNMKMFTFTGGSNNTRTLNIENAVIDVGDIWGFGGTLANLLATGSRISVLGHFSSMNNHQYYNLSTSGLFPDAATNIDGNLIFNELTLNHSRTITGNNTVAKLFIAPKNITLTLAPNSIQTISNDLSINGTPCAFNVITSSGKADIKYANPNNHNRYDYVNLKNIKASNAKLEFDVNSTDLSGNDANIVFLPGAQGLVGLEPSFTCRIIDPAVAETYTLSAKAFYGGPLSTYKWSKKNSNGTFDQLPVSSTALTIDVRDFGFDGVYKAEIVYDSTADKPCYTFDEVSTSYTPIDIKLPPGGDNLVFCIGDGKTLADLKIDATTQGYMTATSAVLNWYSATAGGLALPMTTALTDGEYFGSLTSTANCESVRRVKVTVKLNAKPIADAGVDQKRGFNYPILFTMAANNPTVGVGKWVLVSGDATINNSTAYNTTVTLNAGATAELQWIVDNLGCAVSDNVILSKATHVPRANPNLRMRVSQ